jgi:hypothetical protein
VLKTWVTATVPADTSDDNLEQIQHEKHRFAVTPIEYVVHKRIVMFHFVVNVLLLAL